MREESSAEVSSLTGRRVIAFMSANHLEPDIAAEIFVLDGPPHHEMHPEESPTSTDED
jgi:uncharacterized protein YbcI